MYKLIIEGEEKYTGDLVGCFVELEQIYSEEEVREMDLTSQIKSGIVCANLHTIYDGKEILIFYKNM